MYCLINLQLAPVNILPAGVGGGGGHTRGFRQKTIPDWREFDKLMESGSRVHIIWPVFTSRDLMHQARSRVGILDTNGCLYGGD